MDPAEQGPDGSPSSPLTASPLSVNNHTIRPGSQHNIGIMQSGISGTSSGFQWTTNARPSIGLPILRSALTR